MTFYQSRAFRGNSDGTELIRGVRIPDLFDTTPFTINATDQVSDSRKWQEGFYILVTGATGAIGTVIGTVNITFTYEYVPVASAIMSSPLDMAPPGMATIACLDALYQEFRWLQHLSTAQAQDFVAKLMAMDNQSPLTTYSQI